MLSALNYCYIEVCKKMCQVHMRAYVCMYVYPSTYYSLVNMREFLRKNLLHHHRQRLPAPLIHTHTHTDKHTYKALSVSTLFSHILLLTPPTLHHRPPAVISLFAWSYKFKKLFVITVNTMVETASGVMRCIDAVLLPASISARFRMRS